MISKTDTEDNRQNTTYLKYVITIIHLFALDLPIILIVLTYTSYYSNKSRA